MGASYKTINWERAKMAAQASIGVESLKTGRDGL